jgi:hypothetical protein
VALASGASVAFAGPKEDAKKGLALAKSGDCVSAVSYLQKAEAAQHRPTTAAALARCHVALGELFLGWEIYDALSSEKPARDWTPDDHVAKKGAAKKAEELDERLPRVAVKVTPKTVDALVQVAGREVKDTSIPVRAPPDEKIEVRVTAEGYEPFVKSLVLSEGEIQTITAALEPEKAKGGEGAGKPDVGPKAKPVPAGDTGPEIWLGAKFRGLLMPTFVMNIVAEGGTTTYWPGGFVTMTARVGDVDLVPAIGVTSYALVPTPFKPHDTPDTEWERVESDLVALTLLLDVMYVVPLDAKEEGTFKIGAGFGLGWAFAGDVYRTQTYPRDGKEGDPSQYEPCKGPNDPAGTFRYCNQLDKDADRYGGPDKSWSDGGVRPVVFPWLAFPMMAFGYRPLDDLALDLELGITLNGFLTGAGARYGF